MSNRQIRQIVIKADGTLGAQVMFRQPEDRHGKYYTNVTTRNCGNFVPENMLAEIRKLRPHLLTVCKAWRPENDLVYNWQDSKITNYDNEFAKGLIKDIEDVKIISIDIYDDGIGISGRIKREFDDIWMKFSTEKITESYDLWTELRNIVDNIHALSLKYVDGEITEDNGVVVRKLIASLTDDPESLFKQLTEDVKERLLQDHANKNGKITLTLEELIHPEGREDLEAIKSETTNTKDVNKSVNKTELTPIKIEVPIDKTQKKKVAKKLAVVLDEGEETNEAF